MTRLPNPYTTKGLVVFSLLFLLLVESVWTINYLGSTAKIGSSSETSASASANTVSSEVQAEPSSPTPTTAPTATLSLSPQNLQLKTGQTFKLDLNINPNGKAVDGITVKLNYDPSYLEVIDSDKARSGVQIKTTNLFPVSLNNTVLSGTITLSSVTNPTGPYVTNASKVGEISFKALKAGSSIVSFDFVPGSTSESNVASHDSPGVDMLQIVQDATITIK